MLAITPGEPAGIGPDLVLQLACHARSVECVVIADHDMLADRATRLGIDVQFDANLAAPATRQGQLTVLHTPLARAVQPGKLDVRNAPGVIDSLERAARGCLEKRFDGLVTGPVQKSIIADAGIDFSGHTEFLARLSAAPDVVMMLVSNALRVALATTHLPLRAVADAIDMPLLERRLRILHKALRDDFDITQPRILVAGLNPHAGEGGHLGREEIDVIEPVCERLRAEGFSLVGPLPADTLFTADHLSNADAVMAMFHDQGLPVLKHAGFGEAVNVTLGLGFVRTSVDHGTALDLAGTGRADLGSMRAAIDLAQTLSTR